MQQYVIQRAMGHFDKCNAQSLQAIGQIGGSNLKYYQVGSEPGDCFQIRFDIASDLRQFDYLWRIVTISRDADNLITKSERE